MRRGKLALPVVPGEVLGVAFSPDGKTLAAGYNRLGVRGGGGVLLWDTESWNRLEQAPLVVPEGDIVSVSFSPKAKTLAAGVAFGDGVVDGVLLWDLATWERLVDGTLAVTEGNVHNVAFTPDGKTIAAGCELGESRGEVVLLDVDVESWKQKAGTIANRNFTWKRWQRYLPHNSPYHRTFRSHPWPSDLPDQEREQAEQQESELPAFLEANTS
jgi:WD40 repeat protein